MRIANLVILIVMEIYAGQEILPIPGQLKSIRSSKLEDIIIVNTIDGTLHGVRKSTGKVEWSKPSIWGPNIQVIANNAFESTVANAVSPREQDKIIFIPEPQGDGDIYYFAPGDNFGEKTIKKLDVNIF